MLLEHELNQELIFNLENSAIGKLILHLVNYDRQRLYWVINWLAYFFQRLKKSQVALVLLGEQGAGKGIFFKALIAASTGPFPLASLGLNIAGEHFEAAASGNGPVDAAIKALKKIIDRHMVLKEFTIQAISKGSDDMGKVHMQVEYDGQMYYGFGANTDIIAASVEAYIDCINKFKR
jgi:hypothetical protein